MIKAKIFPLLKITFWEYLCCLKLLLDNLRHHMHFRVILNTALVSGSYPEEFMNDTLDNLRLIVVRRLHVKILLFTANIDILIGIGAFGLRAGGGGVALLWWVQSHALSRPRIAARRGRWEAVLCHRRLGQYTYSRVYALSRSHYRIKPILFECRSIPSPVLRSGLGFFTCRVRERPRVY